MEQNFGGQPSAFDQSWPLAWIAQKIFFGFIRLLEVTRKKLKLSRPRFNIGAKQKSKLQNFVLEGHPNGAGVVHQKYFPLPLTWTAESFVGTELDCRLRIRPPILHSPDIFNWLKIEIHFLECSCESHYEWLKIHERVDIVTILVDDRGSTTALILVPSLHFQFNQMLRLKEGLAEEYQSNDSVLI